MAFAPGLGGQSYGGMLVYNICLITISNSVSDRATNKTVHFVQDGFMKGSLKTQNFIKNV